MSARVASRFLRARKSYSAVSAVAWVSVAGVAVAVAAIVCVLSVFNGFREVIAGRLATLAPDITVTPAAGKAFDNPAGIIRSLRADRDVAIATPVLADNALLIAGSLEMPVTVKGVVPKEWAAVTDINNSLMEDTDSRPLTADSAGRLSPALASIGVAARTGAFTGTDILLFVPRRTGRLNPANPAASFLSDSASVCGLFRTDQEEYDDKLVIVPISLAQKLFSRPEGASAVEVALRPGANPEKTISRLKKNLGAEVSIRDRAQLFETNFRMVNIEKWVTTLLLVFILFIASFNVISTMSMLVLEKRDALPIFRSMGFTRRSTGAIFAWESVAVALIGGIAGIILGSALTLLQQHLGLITIDTGDGLMPYPVRLEAPDLLIALIPTLLIGLLTALISSRFARSLPQ